MSRKKVRGSEKGGSQREKFLGVAEKSSQRHSPMGDRDNRGNGPTSGKSSDKQKFDKKPETGGT